MDDFNKYLEATGETGYVEEMTQSIAQVSGLPGAKLSEIVMFEGGELGQVVGLGVGRVEVLVLARLGVKVGARAVRTGGPLKVAVSEAIIGKIMDGLGNWVGGGQEKIPGDKWLPIDVVPSGIAARKKISRPLETGIALVDLLIPLGRGQRELVMGDRKTGKTNFVLQTILTQSRLGTMCVYAAIGKKNTEIMQAESFFAKTGAIKNLVIVASSSYDTVGEIWLTPYTAMTVAEYFRDLGRDVLLVLDDMTAHAKFYRELSLTARRFPGRESYPGDIFYVHSKLLERAGNFIMGTPPASPPESGGETPQGRGVGEAAITCLPVVDTVAGDMTGYIQTNLMSMTDGHIFFDSDLYFAGRRPAINPFVSVTRVGYQTQSHIRRTLGREIVKRLNDFEKTQSFVRFGAELGEAARQVLTMGEHLLRLFNQPIQVTVAQDVQTVAATMVLSNLWDGSEVEVLQEKYDKDETLRREMKEVVDKATTTEQLIVAVREKQWLAKDN